MFKHEGPSRTPRKNAQVAACLAFIAGFVNSGGFLLIGSFTSHVTGNVGRLGNDLAFGDYSAAIFALIFVLMFFAGAAGASLIIESHSKRTVPRAYGAALLVEGVLLAGFIIIAGVSKTKHPRMLDAQAAILSLAMGMQNSMVTRLSGAVVRTTHLTGVVTDLGIETARWVRWHLYGSPEKPERHRAFLLLIIIGSFIFGSIVGALSTAWASRWAMAAPAIGVIALSMSAIRERE